MPRGRGVIGVPKKPKKFFAPIKCVGTSDKTKVLIGNSKLNLNLQNLAESKVAQ
jgi:hypothetical protein